MKNLLRMGSFVANAPQDDREVVVILNLPKAGEESPSVVGILRLGRHPTRSRNLILARSINVMSIV